MVKVIEGREVEAKVGMTLEHQSGRFAELLPCEWDGAAFRFPHAFDWNPPVAIDIEITGRTFVKRGVEYYVKVGIIYRGDGEPDQRASGWLRIHCVYDLPLVERASV
jgi:hypothetical protein